MTVEPKFEPAHIIKVKNGYMVMKAKTMYETPYEELCVFNSFESLMRHLAGHFDDNWKS